MTSTRSADHPLAFFLMLSVPLRVMEYKRRGGPQDEDFDRVRGFAQVLAEKGDRLLYKSDVPGETADIANRTADAIAVMSFLPGGITLFGEHWESNV